MLGVGLVRGINVGGAARVSKSDLAAAFQDAGFRDVVTLLQSGNAVFVADGEPGRPEADAVEAGLLARAGVAAKVVLLAEREFRSIVAANPLVPIATDDSRLMVTFLDHSIPDGIDVPSEDSLAPEILRLGERAVYQWCPLGVSKSLVKPPFWRQIGGTATGRNQRTVQRILGELERRA